MASCEKEKKVDDDVETYEECNFDFDYCDVFMKEAFCEAEKGFVKGEVPVGCVIVEKCDKNQVLIAQSHNLTNITKNGTKHCEILCIDKLFGKIGNSNRSDLSNCILYVTVEPCIMCAYALSLMKIYKVFYGCKNFKFGGNGSILKLNQNYQSFGGYYSNKAINLLKNFYQQGNLSLPPKKRARLIKIKQNDNQNDKQNVKNENSNVTKTKDENHA